jgi:hypothetical protein
MRAHTLTHTLNHTHTRTHIHELHMNTHTHTHKYAERDTYIHTYIHTRADLYQCRSVQAQFFGKYGNVIWSVPRLHVCVCVSTCTHKLHAKITAL